MWKLRVQRKSLKSLRNRFSLGNKMNGEHTHTNKLILIAVVGQIFSIDLQPLGHVTPL